ncbi:unnamed protein product [Rhizoctonia solani]|uniref:Uncharacterized protein n=1 Tax=Rhizoctonia solani TaxID=456999 RepID=A0A8H2XVG0_9AGAM|nr:unnamed protein product [Rhizoctonia solani]
MKNVFALLAGFVLLVPAVLASPIAFPGGGGSHCIEVRAKCEGGDCHGGDGGDDGVSICIGHGHPGHGEPGHGGED